MNKLIKDNKVAVLYSPGFGAGWYTWNYLNPEILFDPFIVKMVEDKTDSKTIELYCEEKYPNGYFGGAEDLEIAWVEVNRDFRIEEFDGNESIMFRDNDDEWIKA
jgi:hypothetical protein